MKSQDEQFMQEALRLAEKARGWTFPNPMVGAVLVKNGKRIGQGYYQKAGNPHAEIEAFTSATEDPKGATLYVSLEPHNHYGKTPPCTDAIIAKGVKRVVCAVADPNPKVNGSGIEKLKKAGIDVMVGVCEEEAKQQNEAFFTFHTKNRPFVTLKYAASLDGKIATRTHDSKWISNEEARRIARNLRAEHQAILVGINTVLHDNPNLGAREKGKKDPLRIILDSTLQIPLESDVLRDNNVLVVTTRRASKEKVQALQEKERDVLQLSTEKIGIPDLLEELTKREIISVFVEGGAEVHGSFVDAKAVDRFYIFIAPMFIGGRAAVSAVRGEGVATVAEALQAKNITIQKLDDNILLTGTF